MWDSMLASRRVTELVCIFQAGIFLLYAFPDFGRQGFRTYFCTFVSAHNFEYIFEFKYRRRRVALPKNNGGYVQVAKKIFSQNVYTPELDFLRNGVRRARARNFRKLRGSVCRILTFSQRRMKIYTRVSCNG